jgi:tellurite methyltransferase
MPPNPLLIRYASLLSVKGLQGPILDLACGAGENGLFLAAMGLPVILADRNREALRSAKREAQEKGLKTEFWDIDLETGDNPFEEETFRAILVFRYLHRPLIPCIRKGVRKGGLIIYETFTVEQPKYGHPHNPDFLLKPGELFGWFEDWHVIHYLEGLFDNPTRAMSQIVCRKPL